MSFNMFKRYKESASKSRDRRGDRFETAVPPPPGIYTGAASNSSETWEPLSPTSTISSTASSYNEASVSSSSLPMSSAVMEHWAADTARSGGSPTAIRRKPVPAKPKSTVGGTAGRTETVAAAVDTRGGGAESHSPRDAGRQPSETGVPAGTTETAASGLNDGGSRVRSAVEKMLRGTGILPESPDGSRSAPKSRRARMRARESGFVSAWSVQARRMVTLLSRHTSTTGGRVPIALAATTVLIFLLWAFALSDGGSVAGLTPTSPVIAIMGETGAGKSSFIKALGGRDGDGNPPVIGHTLNSTTKIASWYSAGVGKKGFYILDTPGFDDSYMSDFEILEGLTKELAAIYKDARPLTGIVYMHDISKEKMGKTSHKSLRTFQSLVGETSLKNVVLVTTHWARFFKGAQTLREEELRTTFWASMLARGSQILRHSGSRRSALRIVKMLLDREPVVIRIVEQTIRDKLPVGQTDAGSVVADGLRDLEGKLVDNIASVNEEMADIKGRQEQIRKYAAAEAKRLENEWKRASRQQREEIERQMKEIRRKSEQEVEELSGQLVNARNEKQALWNRIDSLQKTVKKLKDRIAEVESPEKGGPTVKRAGEVEGVGFFGRIRNGIKAALGSVVAFIRMVGILLAILFISTMVSGMAGMDFPGAFIVFVPAIWIAIEFFGLPRLAAVLTLCGMLGLLVVVAVASESRRRY
ncbi:hypothetical protein Dda_1781 [Drechslerella dactyloides]|uniref:G domain-containing protein n=1 Tax=Drechslerella dactyloides TaxID=74499 RepID=A0AAD6J4N3_DREDA|nr:hypothetical protein Dda_1781 [Drechslerella dactyloides]